MESKRIPFEGILTPDQLRGGMIRFRWTIRNRRIAVDVHKQVMKEKGISDDVLVFMALSDSQKNELWTEARIRLTSLGFSAAADELPAPAGSAI
jgi:hypothetical protein